GPPLAVSPRPDPHRALQLIARLEDALADVRGQLGVRGEERVDLRERPLRGLPADERRDPARQEEDAAVVPDPLRLLDRGPHALERELRVQRTVERAEARGPPLLVQT